MSSRGSSPSPLMDEEEEVSSPTRVFNLATLPYDIWYETTSACVLCCEFEVV